MNPILQHAGQHNSTNEKKISNYVLPFFFILHISGLNIYKLDNRRPKKTLIYLQELTKHL